MDCVDLDLFGEPPMAALPTPANDSDEYTLRFDRLLRVIRGAVTPAE